MAGFFRAVNLLRSLGLKAVYGKIVTKSWGREEGRAWWVMVLYDNRLERSARTGCVLALRWNLDKPFSMSEPPAEYKGFLSKKPDKLGWRDESCCILWMQNCTATMKRLTLEAINTIGCHWYRDNSVVTWGSFMFGAHMPLSFTTPGVRITNQLLELLLENTNKISIACAGALRAL